MSEMLSVEEKIERLLFEFHRMYRHMASNTEFKESQDVDADDASLLGSWSSFQLCVEDFAQRTLPDDKKYLAGMYSKEVTGIYGASTAIEAKIFSNMPPTDLALYYSAITAQKTVYNVSEEVFFARFVSLWGLDHGTLQKIKDYKNDHPALMPRIVLTRLLPHYKDMKPDHGDTPESPRQHAQNTVAVLVEKLIDVGTTPLTPEEMQEFVESFIVSRIKEDDRLIPSIYDPWQNNS